MMLLLLLPIRLLLPPPLYFTNFYYYHTTTIRYLYVLCSTYFTGPLLLNSSVEIMKLFIRTILPLNQAAMVLYSYIQYSMAGTTSEQVLCTTILLDTQIPITIPHAARARLSTATGTGDAGGVSLISLSERNLVMMRSNLGCRLLFGLLNFEDTPVEVFTVLCGHVPACLPGYLHVNGMQLTQC